jgi:hypothetical protein
MSLGDHPIAEPLQSACHSCRLAMEADRVLHRRMTRLSELAYRPGFAATVVNAIGISCCIRRPPALEGRTCLSSNARGNPDVSRWRGYVRTNLLFASLSAAAQFGLAHEPKVPVHSHRLEVLLRTDLSTGTICTRTAPGAGVVHGRRDTGCEIQYRNSGRHLLGRPSLHIESFEEDAGKRIWPRVVA